MPRDCAGGDLAAPALSPALGGRLVRLPQLGPVARQPDPRPAVRRRPDAAGLSWRARRSSRHAKASRAPWTAHTCAVLLGDRRRRPALRPGSPTGLTLISLAVLIELIVRIEARMLEEGGYFEDGVFGYDFTEGYTSLERAPPRCGPTAKARSSGGAGGGPSCAASAGSPARPPRNGGWMRSSKSCTAKDAARLPTKSNGSSFASARGTAIGPRTRD